MRYVLAGACVLSALLLPAWVTVLLALFVATVPSGMYVLLVCGLCIDLVYGAPLAALGGFQYLYTATFLIGGSVALAMRQRVLD